MVDLSKLQAKDVMTSPVRAIDRSLSAEEAMRILSEERVSGAPVVDGRGVPVGVVTLVDLADFLTGIEREPGEIGAFYARGYLRWDPSSDTFANFDYDEDPLRGTLVEDLMSKELIAVELDTPLEQVVRVLADEGVHRVLVLRDGRLQGLISSTDVIRTLAEGERRAA